MSKNHYGRATVLIFNSGDLVERIELNNTLSPIFPNSLAGMVAGDANSVISKYKAGTDNNPDPGTPTNGVLTDLNATIGGTVKALTNKLKTDLFTSQYQLDLLETEANGNDIGEFALLTEDERMVARIVLDPKITKNATTKITVLWRINYT